MIYHDVNIHTFMYIYWLNIKNVQNMQKSIYFLNTTYEIIGCFFYLWLAYLACAFAWTLLWITIMSKLIWVFGFCLAVYSPIFLSLFVILWILAISFLVLIQTLLAVIQVQIQFQTWEYMIKELFSFLPDILITKFFS